MRCFALAAAMSALLASSLSAANVYVTPTMAGFLDINFNPVAPELDKGDGKLKGVIGQTYLAQVDVAMRIEELSGGAVGFSNTAFNAVVNGNGFIYSNSFLGIPAWNPSDEQVDSNGPEIGGVVSKWDINADDGPNKNDVRSVILAGATKNFGPEEYDSRRKLGQDGDEFAGSVFVAFSCFAGQTANLQVLTPFASGTKRPRSHAAITIGSNPSGSGRWALQNKAGSAPKTIAAGAPIASPVNRIASVSRSSTAARVA